MSHHNHKKTLRSRLSKIISVNLFQKDLTDSLREIRSMQQNNSEPCEQINRYRGAGLFADISAKQNSEEIEQFFYFIRERRPKVVCEIGTYKGGSIYLWSLAAADDALIISIDLPPGLENAYNHQRQIFYQQFALGSQVIVCLPGNSQHELSAAKVKTLLGNRKIDFLFIDGDHRYKGVKEDFALYSPHVAEGGVIAFHDILPRENNPDIEVDKLWNELKPFYKNKEFIGKTGKPVGIGALYK